MKKIAPEVSERLRWVYIILAFIILFHMVEWFGFPVWVECALTMLIICIPAYYVHYFVDKKAWGSVALIISGILLYAFYYSYGIIDSMS